MSGRASKNVGYLPFGKFFEPCKVFYKSSDFFVHSNQTKPYPSLCVKPTSRLTIRNITTQTLDRKTLVFQNKSPIFP